MNRIIIHITAPDQKGIVTKYTELLSSLNINITNLEQHVEPDDMLFFMRIAADTTNKDFNYLKPLIQLEYRKSSHSPYFL